MAVTGNQRNGGLKIDKNRLKLNKADRSEDARLKFFWQKTFLSQLKPFPTGSALIFNVKCCNTVAQLVKHSHFKKSRVPVQLDLTDTGSKHAEMYDRGKIRR